MVAVEGKLYVYGGYEKYLDCWYSCSTSHWYYDDLWSFDPESLVWTKLTSTLTGRWLGREAPGLAVWGGRLFVFGGEKDCKFCLLDLSRP